MESRYDIKEVESRIYKKWEESGLFNPDVAVEKGVTRADAGFKTPDGFDEIERRKYDDTEFAFLRLTPAE